MNKAEQRIAEALASALALGLVLLFAFPILYVLAVLGRTGSKPLLAAALATAILLLMSIVTHSGALAHAGALVALLTVAIAAIVDIQSGAATRHGSNPRLPFEGHLR